MGHLKKVNKEKYHHKQLLQLQKADVVSFELCKLQPVAHGLFIIAQTPNAFYTMAKKKLTVPVKKVGPLYLPLENSWLTANFDFFPLSSVFEYYARAHTFEFFCKTLFVKTVDVDWVRDFIYPKLFGLTGMVTFLHQIPTLPLIETNCPACKIFLG